MPQSDAIIGRVAVKVLPDTSGFRKRAQAQLKKVEKKLKPLQIDMEFKQTQVKKAVKKLQDDVDGVKADVGVNLAEATRRKAQAQLAYLARTRIVSLVPKVDHRAAIAAASTLAALSGARSLNKTLKSLWDNFKNLDKSVPIIGSIALAVAGLASWAGSAASNLFSLSSSLAQIGPAGLALPGIFGGMAIGVGATIAVLKDFNKVLPKVGKQFSALQNVMSRNFYAKAKVPFQSMIDKLFPQFAAGLERTASSLGTFFAALAASLQESLDGLLGPMFDDLNESIEITASRTDAFAGIIATLGRVGAGYLPRLARWFGDISVQFDNFLTKADKDGRLEGWIDTGIFLMKELGRVLAGFGSIFASIARAAEAAGGSTLTSLADTLDRIAKQVKGPVFQKALTDVFKSFHVAIDRIVTKSGPAFKDFMLTLSRLLARVMPIIGDTIGIAFRAIFDALDQPAVTKGITKFFEGLRKGVRELAPYLPVIAEALGLLVGLMGTLAANLGPIIGQALGIIAEAFIDLAPSIGPVVEALSGVLVSALDALAVILPKVTPLLVSLFDWIARNPELALVIVGIAFGLGALVSALGPLISFGAAVVPILGAVAGAITPMGLAIAGAVGLIALAFAGVGAALVFMFWKVKPLRDALSDLWENVLKPLGEQLFTQVKEQWPSIKRAFSDLGDSLIRLGEVAAPLFQRWVDGLITATPTISRFASFTLAFLINQLRIVIGIFETIADIATFGLMGLTNALALFDFSQTLVQPGRTLIQGFISGMMEAGKGINPALGVLLDGAMGMFPRSPVKEGPLMGFNNGAPGKKLMDMLIGGIDSRKDAVVKSFKGVAAGISDVELNADVSGRNARAVSSALAGSTGTGSQVSKTLIYHAAPGSSLDSEEDLFAAAERSRMVGW